MLTVRIASISEEAERVRSLVLEDPSGEKLPAFEPGAHIDVHIPGGFTRQYSLCDPPLEDHYRIAVLNVPNGRGGSLAMHQMRAGDVLQISEPRNMFPLVREASHSILIAGGIGITPILAMGEHLQRRRQSFELHYCAQSRERAAFLERISSLGRTTGKVNLHFDGGDPANHLDVETILRKYESGAHLYYCGPSAFMTAVAAASRHWPRDAVHWESFSSPSQKVQKDVDTKFFSVRLSRSNLTIRAAAGEPILKAVRNAGLQWDSSCEAGVCGTCRVRHLAGCMEHNDYVLTEDERREYVMICCAYPTDDSLVLDM